jgi:two-component system, NtrC family, response regulator AtoC
MRHVTAKKEPMSQSAPHVIIADDDPGVRAIIAYIIQQTYPAATITSAYDGMEALDAYDQRGADIVVTNQTMPRLSGLELIAALRARQASLPIIMVSGETSHAPIALASGAARFVAKPFTYLQIVYALRSVRRP